VLTWQWWALTRLRCARRAQWPSLEPPRASAPPPAAGAAPAAQPAAPPPQQRTAAYKRAPRDWTALEREVEEEEKAAPATGAPLARAPRARRPPEPPTCSFAPLCAANSHRTLPAMS
jgi:hypothetical protein